MIYCEFCGLELAEILVGLPFCNEGCEEAYSKNNMGMKEEY